MGPNVGLMVKLNIEDKKKCFPLRSTFHYYIIKSYFYCSCSTRWILSFLDCPPCTVIFSTKLLL